jgi:hypothetical protein
MSDDAEQQFRKITEQRREAEAAVREEGLRQMTELKDRAAKLDTAIEKWDACLPAVQVAINVVNDKVRAEGLQFTAYSEPLRSVPGLRALPSVLIRSELRGGAAAFVLGLDENGLVVRANREWTEIPEVAPRETLKNPAGGAGIG